MSQKDEISELRREIRELGEEVRRMSRLLDGALQGDWKEMLDPFVAQDYSLRRNIEKTLWDNSQNIHLALRWAETVKAAEFVLENIPLSRHYDAYHLRTAALDLARSDGLFLEFGVADALWINLMADYRKDVTFYGFDTFEGLPEPWSLWQQGHYARAAKPPEVRRNVKLVKGLFQDTLAPFLQEHDLPISFIHLDCDLYSASKFVLETVRPRLRPGTCIVLDDFLTQPGWERDQFRAFLEVQKEYDWKFEYTGYTRIPPCTGVSIRIL